MAEQIPTPQANPTLVYHVVEALTRKLNIQAPYQQGIDAAIAHLAQGNARNTTPPASMYHKFDIERREFGGSPTFIIRSRVTAPQRRCLFLHGGGGMMRATPFHYAFITRLILQTQAEVWMPFYPLAPGVNFYDSLDACLAAHQAMLAEPHQLPIYFAGDSAGANLELAVCRRALDSGLNGPHAVICMSPATGMEAPDYRETFAAQARATRDPMLCVEMIDGIRDNWYADVPLDGTLSNPAYMDFAGFPPVLLFLGTAEIFYPATEAIAKRMEAAGVPLTVSRGVGLMHDWALLNYFPEGAAAQVQIKRFVLRICRSLA